MDKLRTGIGLQGYGQKDPLVEYKRESYMYLFRHDKAIYFAKVIKLYDLFIHLQ